MSQSDTPIAQAADDLLAIRELEKPTSAFQKYYTRRLVEKITSLEAEILKNENLSGDKLQAKRVALWALYDLRDMMSRDKQACLAMDRSAQNEAARG